MSSLTRDHSLIHMARRRQFATSQSRYVFTFSHVLIIHETNNLTQLFINFVLSTPTIFLSLPIWLNLASHLSMSIVVLVFSGKIFGRGWPDDSFCRRWNGPPDYGFTPGPRKCFRQRDIIRINMGVAAGFGILIGYDLLIVLKSSILTYDCIVYLF